MTLTQHPKIALTAVSETRHFKKKKQLHFGLNAEVHFQSLKKKNVHLCWTAKLNLVQKSSEKKNTVNIGHQTDNTKAQKSDLGTVSESGSNLNIALLVIVVIPVVKFI